MNYEKNPQYLFARLGIAELHLRRGEVDRFEEVMDKKFDLKLMFPHRDVFHISEYVSFSALMIKYFIHKREFRGAEVLLDTMEEIAPGYEQTELAREMMSESVLLRAARGLARLTLGRGKLPR
jgi:hypothetical protein